MIVPTMTFLLVVSLVASVAAVAGDRGLRRLGLSTRWVWLAAMAGGALLLGLGELLPPRSLAATGVMRPIPLPDLTVGGGAGLLGRLLGLAPGALWALASVTTVAVLARTHRRLERERARWERRRVLGREVFVSADRGPAVAGVLRPWIVLPRWVLALSQRELAMVLLHEEEHVRARDCALLAGGLGLVVLTAWNPVVWWQLRRLRTAMELDCDRRVLRRDPDAGAYGESLIHVAARVAGPSLGLAAFTEKGVSLKHRIRAMTEKKTRWTGIGGGALLVLAALIGIQACNMDNPVATDVEPGEAAVAEQESIVPAGADPRAEPPPVIESVARVREAIQPVRTDEDIEALMERTREEIAREPTFTPMTARPEILNRTEVIAEMERSYPPLLRGAGIGGTIRVHFFIDEEGRVRNTRIAESSRHRALDEAALRVASVYRFSPARNGEAAVPVWVQFGITFDPS